MARANNEFTEDGSVGESNVSRDEARCTGRRRFGTVSALTSAFLRASHHFLVIYSAPDSFQAGRRRLPESRFSDSRAPDTCRNVVTVGG